MSWIFAPVAASLSWPLFLLSGWLFTAPTGPVYVPHPYNAVAIVSLAPDTGTVGEQVTIAGSGFTADNTIHFGSGVIMHVAAKSAVYNCPMQPAGASGTCGSAQQTITFTVPSGLDPACAFSQPRCMIATRRVTAGRYDVSVQNQNGTSNTLSFTVTATPTPTNPVIYSITPKEGPTGTTVTIDGFGFTSDNTVHFGDGAITHVTSSNGIAIACTRDPNCRPGIHQSITFTVPNQLAPNCALGMMCPMYMRLVTPGSYPVTIENTNGTSNKVNFTVTGSENGNGTISINGIDAPSTLAAGATGTWTVHAITTNGSTLHYSVNWGDTASAAIMAPAPSPVSASATFTHAYQGAGTYTPTFTVTDDLGHTATVSATVTVTPWY